VPGVVGRDVYMCGPPGMTAAVRTSLTAIGVPLDHIHEERFVL
jgi:ferredoxin-NADP reductase